MFHHLDRYVRAVPTGHVQSQFPLCVFCRNARALDGINTDDDDAVLGVFVVVVAGSGGTSCCFLQFDDCVVSSAAKDGDAMERRKGSYRLE
jgi:hypothetical protein